MATHTGQHFLKLSPTTHHYKVLMQYGHAAVLDVVPVERESRVCALHGARYVDGRSMTPAALLLSKHLLALLCLLTGNAMR